MSDSSSLKPHSLGHAMVELGRRWPYMAALGILFMVLGFLALTLDVTATIASVWLIGVFMAVAGGSEIIMGFDSRSWGRALLWVLAGVLYVIAGAIAIAQPMFAATIFTLMLGAGLTATGLTRLWVASHLPPGRKALGIFSGVMTLALGVVIILGWPGNGAFVLGVLLGLDLIFYGANWISLALVARAHHRTRSI